MIQALTTFDGHQFAAIAPVFENHILTITLNRPEKKNAINDVMVNELIYALDYAKSTRAVRVVILAAAGNVFCAGGDLKAMHGATAAGPASTVPPQGEIDDMVVKLYHLNKPVIAKVQGPVLAGALLMICNATHVVAVEEAFFSAPEIKRGLWPFQVMAGLFRVMPRRAALDFIMRGERISAQQAEQLGLINETVSMDALQVRVDQLASELAALAPSSMQLGLAAFRAQEQMTFDEALPFLKGQFLQCVASDDAKEGIAAFFDKRQPRWKD